MTYSVLVVSWTIVGDAVAVLTLLGVSYRKNGVNLFLSHDILSGCSALHHRNRRCRSSSRSCEGLCSEGGRSDGADVEIGGTDWTR